MTPKRPSQVSASRNAAFPRNQVETRYPAQDAQPDPTRQLEDVRPNCGLAIAYFHTKRFTEAEAAARRAIEFSPEFSVPHALLTAALMRLGGVKEAKASARRVLTLQPSFTVRGFRMTVGLSPPVFADFAEAWREAGIPE